MKSGVLKRNFDYDKKGTVRTAEVNEAVNRLVNSYGQSKKKLKVLCLPGFKGLDAKLWIKKGVSPGNITGVEQDEIAASHLARRRLGIRVVRSPLRSYLRKSKPQQFDYVSIDTCAQVSSEVVEALYYLSERRWLKDRVGITLANSMSRNALSTYEEAAETHKIWNTLGIKHYPAPSPYAGSKSRRNMLWRCPIMMLLCHVAIPMGMVLDGPISKWRYNGLGRFAMSHVRIWLRKSRKAWGSRACQGFVDAIDHPYSVIV